MVVDDPGCAQALNDRNFSSQVYGAELSSRGSKLAVAWDSGHNSGMVDQQGQGDRLRQIVEEVLCGGSQGLASFHNFINGVKARADGEDLAFDPNVVVEHWWQLARTGVIALSGDNAGLVRTINYPAILITARGKALLQRGENSPHNPQRYLNALKRRVANADPDILAYLDEAVGAWAAGLYRSSAVMLGCACEKLILIMAISLANKGADALAKKLADSRTSISVIYEEVRQNLLAKKQTLPPEVADKLDRKLSPIFDHARILRNASGHPTGASVTTEDAEAGLLLFPGFYAMCDQIIRAINESGASANT